MTDAPPAELEREIQALRFEVAALRREVHGQGRALSQFSQLLDVLATPPWRRLRFALEGWQLWRLGRWRR